MLQVNCFYIASLLLASTANHATAAPTGSSSHSVIKKSIGVTSMARDNTSHTAGDVESLVSDSFISKVRPSETKKLNSQENEKRKMLKKRTLQKRDGLGGLISNMGQKVGEMVGSTISSIGSEVKSSVGFSVGEKATEKIDKLLSNNKSLPKNKNSLPTNKKSFPKNKKSLPKNKNNLPTNKNSLSKNRKSLPKKYKS